MGICCFSGIRDSKE